MTYVEQLKDLRWVALRDRRLEFDGFRCKQCGERIMLQVHHIGYVPGKMAWEYDIKDLITLCHECHEKYHINEREIRLPNKREEVREETLRMEERFDLHRSSNCNEILAKMPKELVERIKKLSQRKR